MNDYFCTGGPRPENNCGGPPPRPMPRPECDQCANVQEHPQMQEPCQNRREERCPCRGGLVQGLQMLLRTGLSSLVDFQAFAFITEDFLVGDSLEAATPAATAYDNLAATLAGSFNRFSPCACDYIDVTGTVYLPTATAADAVTGLTASRLNLCDVSALAFGVVPDTTEPATDNFASARAILQRLLQGPCRPDCPPYPDPCDEACNCCSGDDFFGGSVSLVVDGLLLANVSVVGKVGKILVLSNDTDERFYFVCAEKATFIQ